jgi:hypothetical protein
MRTRDVVQEVWHAVQACGRRIYLSNSPVSSPMFDYLAAQRGDLRAPDASSIAFRPTEVLFRAFYASSTILPPNDVLFRGS